MKRSLNYTLSLCTLLLVTFSSINFLSAQSNFTDYPWLNDIIDIEDCCANQRVTAYQSGIFTYIYIERGAECRSKGDELYFEDGTFYCAELNDLNCLEAYGLTADNATLLWDCDVEEQEEENEVENIVIVCTGDSAFLPAIQTFPTPPLGPAGPNGELPEQPCTPILNAIEINSDAENFVAEDLLGFTVFPTENVVYTITSKGFCGGPGFVNTDEDAISYQIIIDNECIDQAGCASILELEWLQTLIKEACTGNIYQIEYNGAPAVYVATLCGCVDGANNVYNCDGEWLCGADGAYVSPLEIDQCNNFAAINEQLTEANLLWAPACDCPCPVDLKPVCGIDGQMYESACEAICAGIEVVGEEDCNSTSSCKALDNLNINANFCNSCFSEVAIYEYEGEEYLVTKEESPFCSDGINTVMNCDSTVAFCLNGGIAGLQQCEAFFKDANIKEIIWSRNRDCDIEVVFAAPCTDLQRVDFGLCEAIMGIGIVEGKCKTISGCLDYVVKGVDYSTAFFPTVEICQQTCGTTGEKEGEIFDDFEWLADLIDPNDCKGASAEVFDLGAFSFVHVQTEESGELFFEDGTFYCLDMPDYDCRSLYSLMSDQITDTWRCEVSGPVSPDNSLIGQTTTTTAKIVDFKAFPNPTTGLVNVQLNLAARGPQTVTVYDLHGRVIEQNSVVDGQSIRLDLSNQTAGIYLIELRTNNERELQKIVKQ